MASIIPSVGVLLYVSLASCLPQSGNSDTYTSESKLRESALSVTNGFRSQHGAAPVAWNNTLADIAKTWASRCQFEHSMGALGVTGENLAYGYPDMKAAIDVWGNERDLYDFNAPTGFTHETGHFTQLVWKETVSMGCAAVDCNNKGSMSGYFVVCEYWPQGNILSGDLGYFKANVQAQGGYNAPEPAPNPSPVPSASPPVAETIVSPSAISTVLPPPVLESSEARYIPPPPPSSSLHLPPPQSKTMAPAAPTSTEEKAVSPLPSSTSASIPVESPIWSSSPSSSTPNSESTTSSVAVAPVSESTENPSDLTPAETLETPLASETSSPLPAAATEISSTVETSAIEVLVEESLPVETFAFSRPLLETFTTVETFAAATSSEPAGQTPWVPSSAAIKTSALPVWAAGLISLIAVVFV